MTRYTVDGDPLPEWERELLDVQEIERITGERDRARDTAVRLEQENARLLAVANDLIADVRKIDLEGGVDLERWPRAQALIDVVEGPPCQ